MRKYGIIPFNDTAQAIGIFGIVTIPLDFPRITIDNAGGEIECKIVEHLTWSNQQDNFLNARWNAFFDQNPGAADNFIKVSNDGLDLGDTI